MPKSHCDLNGVKRLTLKPCSHFKSNGQYSQVVFSPTVIFTKEDVNNT